MAIQIKGSVPSPTPAPAVQSVAPPPPPVEAKPVKAGPGELSAVLNKIRKELGEKSVVLGSQVPNVRRLPTGVFEFDLATGGGFPFNRYSIVYGPESSGKTNLIYKAIAQAQRLPPPCNKAVFIDLEGTFDGGWASHFGVDLDTLIVAKPSYGEQAVDMIDALVRANDVAFLAVDSIAVLIAAKEVEGSTEKADVGTSALLIKRLSNKLAIALSEEQKRDHEISVVLLNQTRFKIGVMFGDPETMPGGQTVKFNASLIIRISGKNKVVKEISATVPAFKETTIRVKKAKVGIIQGVAEYDLCMLDHDGLCVGETDSFGKVKNYLQASGHLSKIGSEWVVQCPKWPKATSFKTLAAMQDLYRAEDGFALALQQQVVDNLSMEASVVAAESLAEGETDGGS
jgi:recombination protein RecA